MSGNGRQRAFDAMADGTRRQILQLLAERSEATVNEIAEQVDGVGRTAISNHLRILRAADLVTERRDGRFRRYSLAPDSPAHAALSFLQEIVSAAIPSPERVAGHVARDATVARAKGA